MCDREKVIKGLEEVIAEAVYPDRPRKFMMSLELAEDALALLKAQEPVRPRVAHDGWYRCGACGNSLASGERVNYEGFLKRPWPLFCEMCGRAVQWK